MKTIVTEPNQSIVDIAVQEYGNLDAFNEIVANNDLLGKMVQPVIFSSEVDLACSVVAGTTLNIDDASILIDKKKIADLKGAKITTGLGNYRIFNFIFNNKFA